MIQITPNRAWINFSTIYGSSDILRRYQWFQYEFGKRASELFLKNLGQRISKLPGSVDYKKRLMVAEIRDKGKKSWFAIMASAKSLSDARLDPKETIFFVNSRFKIKGDPVFEILEKNGPWTVNTIPFVPSDRQGGTVARRVTARDVETIEKKKGAIWDTLQAKMVEAGIPFEDRLVVYQKLRVVRDLEADAIAYEFGLRGGRPHWRPSLRWLKKQGIKEILIQEKDLVRVWTSPKFTKYRAFRRLNVKLTQKDLVRIQEFQDKVRL